ncbi:hypothetical protein L0128_00440 [candidate division KSB1 bacterium]|nr:hypothetical protein [candidate division KSB1 bacterium]
MFRKYWIRGLTILVSLGLGSCASQRPLAYQRQLPHQIKRIAVLMPDTTAAAALFPAEYLQKMLAYMLFHERAYYVQALDTTNALLTGVDWREASPQFLKQRLGVDAILQYDFFDAHREKPDKGTFLYSISLLDLRQGKVVWQALREYQGKAQLKSLQPLKQYFQSKVKEGTRLPFFEELYFSLRSALQTLKNPDFTEDELTARLIDTNEPF